MRKRVIKNKLMIEAGSVVDGNTLIQKIGEGGFGEVWQVKNNTTDSLKALKLIPKHTLKQFDQELKALKQYSEKLHLLRSPYLLHIEGISSNQDYLYYFMPLADSENTSTSMSGDWNPLTLATVIDAKRSQEEWFTIHEIRDYIAPILKGLQLLSDSGLAHRDVKPENIIFFNNIPCLGDIGLVGEDKTMLTRMGTPYYLAPSYYTEEGGHPDKWGIITTLYTMMTGNLPDKLGREKFRYPPNGKISLNEETREKWGLLKEIIFRETEVGEGITHKSYRDIAEEINSICALPSKGNTAKADGDSKQKKSTRKKVVKNNSKSSTPKEARRLKSVLPSFVHTKRNMVRDYRNVLGIDFGTSNTVVSYWSPRIDKIEIIPILGSKTTATLIEYDETGKILRWGNELKGVEPSPYHFSNFKHLIASDNKVTFQDGSTKDHSDVCYAYLDLIIKEVKKSFFKPNVFPEKMITRLGYPSTWTEQQVQRLHLIAEKLLKLPHVELIPDSLATLSATSIFDKGSKYWFFDIGGYTTEVAVLDYTNAPIPAIIKLNSIDIGGSHFDEIISDIIIEKENEYANDGKASKIDSRVRYYAKRMKEETAEISYSSERVGSEIPIKCSKYEILEASEMLITELSDFLYDNIEQDSKIIVMGGMANCKLLINDIKARTPNSITFKISREPELQIAKGIAKFESWIMDLLDLYKESIRDDYDNAIYEMLNKFKQENKDKIRKTFRRIIERKASNLYFKGYVNDIAKSQIPECTTELINLWGAPIKNIVMDICKSMIEGSMTFHADFKMNHRMLDNFRSLAHKISYELSDEMSKIVHCLPDLPFRIDNPFASKNEAVIDVLTNYFVGENNKESGWEILWAGKDNFVGLSDLYSQAFEMLWEAQKYGKPFVHNDGNKLIGIKEYNYRQCFSI